MHFTVHKYVFLLWKIGLPGSPKTLSSNFGKRHPTAAHTWHQWQLASITLQTYHRRLLFSSAKRCPLHTSVTVKWAAAVERSWVPLIIATCNSDAVTHANHSNPRELRVWHFGEQKDGNAQSSFWMDFAYTCLFFIDGYLPHCWLSVVFFTHNDMVNNLSSHALFLLLTLQSECYIHLDWHSINKDTPLKKPKQNMFIHLFDL